MADSEASVRRRKAEPKAAEPAAAAAAESEPVDSGGEDGSPPKRPKKTPKQRLADDEAYTSLFLDVFRVLAFLFVVSCGLSYLVSNGETFFWGMSNPPKYLKLDWWKKQLHGPLYLTPAELALYDGTDPTKPIYLAINQTIYDVSANRRTYGPGGSYHYFAGCDASRAYVTGCLAEDRTADLRGVEDMFLPLDDPAVDARWGRDELARMRARERHDAEKRVHEGLLHWVNFFRNHQKYEFVGYVKMPEGWPGTEPPRPLCEAAAKGRKPRDVPGKEGKGGA